MVNHTIAIISVHQEKIVLLDTWPWHAAYQTLLCTDPYSVYSMIRCAARSGSQHNAPDAPPSQFDGSQNAHPTMPPRQPFIDVLVKPFDLDEVRLHVQRRSDASLDQLNRILQEAPTTL
jgi:hypothetical protein